MLLKVRAIATLLLFGCLLALTTSVKGADLPVFCGGKGPLTTIASALKVLNPAVPNTLTVSGICKENVLIRGFDHLTLRAKPGATIQDASGGTGLVLNIERSGDAIVEGFIINGGAIGVMCSESSVCHFDGNTVQGASVGIQFVQSRGFFGWNVLQHNGTGLVILESSSVRSAALLIQNNSNSGVDVDTGGSFASFGNTIRDNGASGIEIYHGSAVLVGTTITGNSGNGLTVVAHSSVDFESDSVIAGNGASGVFLRDLSYVEFRGANTVTGNFSGLDVACRPQFPATRGALTNIGGGITDCVEP